MTADRDAVEAMRERDIRADEQAMRGGHACGWPVCGCDSDARCFDAPHLISSPAPDVPVTDEMVERAIDAWDLERVRLNREWHGTDAELCSPAHRANIAPMFRAALLAALRLDAGRQDGEGPT